MTTDADMAWSQLVYFIYHNKQIREEHSAVFDKVASDAQKELMSDLYDHYDEELTLAIKINCNLSYDDLQMLINFMSKNPLANGKFKAGTIGKHELALPKFASLERVKALANRVKLNHGMDINVDTKTVTLNIEAFLQQKVADLGKEWLTTVGGGLVFQLLGDGYNHFRRISIINMAVRLLHADKFAGSPQSLMNCALWQGDESYASVVQNTKILNEVLQRLVRDGLRVTFADDTTVIAPVKVVGGGDMKWILTCMGMSGWNFSIWHLQHSSEFCNTNKKYCKKTTRMAFHLSHTKFDDSDFRQHHMISEVDTTDPPPQIKKGMYVLKIGGVDAHTLSPSDFKHSLCVRPLHLELTSDIYHHELTGDAIVVVIAAAGALKFKVSSEFGLRCPGCSKLFCNETALATEILSDSAEYRRSHFGHNWHRAPVFRFIEIGAFYICTLHLLLRVVGILWKRLIGAKITTAKVANKITGFLHEKMGVYVPPLTTATAQGKVDLAKTMSFTGQEAARVLEYFGDCIAQMDGVPQETKSAVVECTSQFIDYYNELNTSVRDSIKDGIGADPCELAPLLLQKSQTLKKLGKLFVKSYKKLTDDEAITHYIKAITCEIPEMSATVDLRDLSGAALEALNQRLKRTKTSRGGGGGKNGSSEDRLLVRQLAGSRIVSNYLQHKNKVRATFYQRNKTEREGSNLKSKTIS